MDLACDHGPQPEPSGKPTEWSFSICFPAMTLHAHTVNLGGGKIDLSLGAVFPVTLWVDTCQYRLKPFFVCFVVFVSMTPSLFPPLSHPTDFPPARPRLRTETSCLWCCLTSDQLIWSRVALVWFTTPCPSSSFGKQGCLIRTFLLSVIFYVSVAHLWQSDSVLI